jgi:riboflavin kinase/FMN adenylyltransferase
MRVVHELAGITRNTKFAATVGAFDGVHLGHQSLFEQLRRQVAERGVETLAITFDPDPAEVVSPNPPPYLTSLQQRIELIDEIGIDELCIVHFDEKVRNMSAEDFLDRARAHADIAELLVGHDFAMGHDRQGTRAVLEAYAQMHGFACAIAEAFLIDDEPVSASRIRTLMSNGDLAAAARLLGRFPAISGTVVEGDKRGRQIGFPTANLGLDQRWAIPADGVYVANTYVDSRRWHSVVNIGMRPTFNSPQRTIESHILDFSADIYGHPIVVEFLERLRGEQKFSGIEAIREQIGKDAQAARDHFTKLAGD